MDKDKESKKGDQQDSAGQEESKGDQQDSADAGAVDYKAELEAERAKRTKAESDRDNYREGMLNAKDQLKKKKGMKAEEGSEDEKESDDIEDRIASIVDKRLGIIQKSTDLVAFESIVGQYTDDPDEAELIKFHFENSVGGGSVRERIENAHLIANKKKFLKERSEMARSLENGKGVSRVASAGGRNQDVDKGNKDFFSPEQIEALKKRGLDPEKVRENYQKASQK